MIRLKKRESIKELPMIKINYEINIGMNIHISDDLNYKISLSSYDPLIIDVDEEGRPRLMEILWPLDRWEKKILTPPLKYKKERVFLEENDFEDLIFRSNNEKSILHITVKTSKRPQEHIQIADKIILDISKDNYLVGVWITDIPKELWRKQIIDLTTCS